MNFYRHHIGDYRRDTAHLTLIEHGAYRQLLDTYYLNERPIPLETDLVFRRLSARTDDEKQAIVAVLREFFRETPEGWVHGRCDSEIAGYQAKANLARVNGKSGGRPKKTDSVSDGFRDGTDEKPESKANHKPITNNQSPQPPEGAGRTRRDDAAIAERFAKFWFAYPRKVGKSDALKAWMKVAPDEELFQKITDSLAAHCRSRDWLKDNGQFIPHPATWLNGRRWEDEIEGGTDSDDPFAGMV